MSFELVLMKGGRVVLRLPVSDEMPVQPTAEELEALAQFYSIAANERRLRIMIELMRRRESRFTDLLKVGVNPKLVKDCVGPLINAGLVLQRSKRDPYSLSPKGALLITALVPWTLGLFKESRGRQR